MWTITSILQHSSLGGSDWAFRSATDQFEEIEGGHDPFQLPSFQYGETIDGVAAHQIGRLADRGVRGSRDDLLGHQIGDEASMPDGIAVLSTEVLVR